MTSFTRASRASAGRARGLRARLSSFSAVRGPVGLLYAPNVRGTAWATGFLSWRRGNVTLTQRRDPPRLFHIIIFIVPRSIEIDMKSSRVVVTARCVSRHARPRRGRGVAGLKIRARRCAVEAVLRDIERARAPTRDRGCTTCSCARPSIPQVTKFVLVRSSASFPLFRPRLRERKRGGCVALRCSDHWHQPCG